jgi:hypothetical protein
MALDQEQLKKINGLYQDSKFEMRLLKDTMRASDTARILELEKRYEGSTPRGDFEGSVTGYWVRLDARGVGIVTYRGKEYKTRTIGFMSLSRGAEVELTYAKGVYYSKSGL